MAQEVYPFTGLRFASIEGSLGGDPKRISGEGKNACVVLRVALNYRTSRGEEGTIWIDVKTFGKLAENAEKSYKKGSRITASGPIEGDEYNGETKLVMNAQTLGASNAFHVTESSEGDTGGGGSRRRSRDEDEEETPARSRRRRDDDDDADETPRSSRRRRDDDEEEDDKPRRSRRRDDDEDDAEDERPSRRRSRRRDDDED